MEAIPEEIIGFVGITLDLTEIEKTATFAYPDALSPLEWHCLRGLTRGRDRAESLKQERDRKDRKLAEAKARLNKQ